MKRILLKLSGEALAGAKGTGFDEATVRGVAAQVAAVVREGVEVGVVIGGGNFWRGRSSDAFDRSKADQIGMLATVMNCLYVSEIFRTEGMQTEVFTPFAVGAFTRLYSRDESEAALRAKKVVFFAGGTGHPFFSTDTATVLRAVEIGAEMILLAKSIDGVYDMDPKKHPEAKKYDKITIAEVVQKNLGVVDGAAAAIALEQKMPMLVFKLDGVDSILKAAKGEIDGTVVTV